MTELDSSHLAVEWNTQITLSRRMEVYSVNTWDELNSSMRLCKL